MHSAEESPAGIEEKGIKVLIVEDDPGDAKLVRRMLSESAHPYDAEVAGSIASAIERLHDVAFDTALLDMGLPDSHGTDTVLRVHTECPDIPLIVLTGLDDEETWIRAVPTGAQDYRVKGAVDSNLLTKSIRYAIARKRAEDLLEIYVKEETNISFVVAAEGVILPISQAIPLGLIINELVSNALKYAFRDTEKGSIEISMCASAGDSIELTVKDDGIGIPEDFEISKTQTPGLKLVRNLAERQLNGEMTVSRDKGTRFCIKYNKSILYGGNDE